MKVDVCPICKTLKERVDKSNSLIVGLIARNLCPLNIVIGQEFHACMAN